MIFLVSSGKTIFFSPKIWFYFLGGKWKIIFLKKIQNKKQKNMEMWYILQMFWKDGLFKKVALEYNLSSIIRKDGISFSRKYDIFSTDWKWKIIFLKKYMEIDAFCLFHKVVSGYLFFLQIWNYPFVKKVKMIFSRKIHLKMAFPALLKKIIFIVEKIILAF